jgi:hypothetical protein
VDRLAGYEPLLVNTGQLLELYWPQVTKLLQPVVDGAMRGEMTINDFHTAINEGRQYLLIAKRDGGELPEVGFCLVMETIAYPQFTVLSIAALGGRELKLYESKFWKHVCSWAYMNGVRTMQAQVSPAMARIASRYGFEPVYATIRMTLTEM